MSLRENWQKFRHWSVNNKFLSLVVIFGSIYILSLPLVRRAPLTAEERARNREITSTKRL